MAVTRIKSLLRTYGSRQLRNRLRKAYYLPRDTVDRVLGRRDFLTPPKGMMFVGSGEFKETGEKYLQDFIGLAGLQPDDRVLDIGCGIGQMAVPLSGYLNGDGSYEGFDIVKEGIEWCRTHVTSRYPRFQFRWVNVYNKEYNPKGELSPSRLRFPYKESSFDFVFLTSVFTHMRLPAVSRYLAEISRVMRTHATCFVTFFLTDIQGGTQEGRDSEAACFKFDLGDCRTVDRNTPEKAIAYAEDAIRRLFADCGLTLAAPIHYGAWRQTRSLLRSQDTIVAVKQA